MEDEEVREPNCIDLKFPSSNANERANTLSASPVNGRECSSMDKICVKKMLWPTFQSVSLWKERANTLSASPVNGRECSSMDKICVKKVNIGFIMERWCQEVISKPCI